MTDLLAWKDPERLFDFHKAPRGPGVYVIGKAIDPSMPVIAWSGYDSYLGRWPDNLQGCYIGISESRGNGIRGRLSKHARCKGNKGIALLIQRRVPLWYITIPYGIADIEALILLLKTGTHFECNVRDELERSCKRQRERVRAAMLQGEREYYDNLDMGEHGEGM